MTNITLFFSVLLGVSVAGCDGIKQSNTKDLPNLDPLQRESVASIQDQNSYDESPPTDQTPPTAPTQLEITSSRSYQSTSSKRCALNLKWNPADDNQTSTEQLIYQVVSGERVQASIHGVTTFHFVIREDAPSVESIHIIAKDKAGNSSSPSNSVDIPVCATQTAPPETQSASSTTPGLPVVPAPVSTTSSLPAPEPANNDVITLNRGTRKKPQGSDNYQSKIDVNCHPDGESKVIASYECDRLPAMFKKGPETPEGTLYFLQRWNPQHLPIVYHVHQDSLVYQKLIEDVVDELNAIAKEAGIVAHQNQTQCTDTTGPLLCLASYPTTAPMEDYDTNTIRVSERKANAYGYSHYYRGGTGEVLDNDVEIILPTVETFAKEVMSMYRTRRYNKEDLRNRRLQHTLMHELMHGFGFSHNLMGTQYGSLMKAPLNWIRDDELAIALSHEFNDTRGEDIDFQTLRYLYIEDTYTQADELPDFEVQRYGSSPISRQKPPA